MAAFRVSPLKAQLQRQPFGKGGEASGICLCVVEQQHICKNASSEEKEMMSKDSEFIQCCILEDKSRSEESNLTEKSKERLLFFFWFPGPSLYFNDCVPP